jgi:hypothetical protein
MLEYKSPTTLDMPEVFTELVENPDPRGPFGAKEVGQGPLLPIMPAVANAIYDAVGVRIDEGADHAREGAARARRKGRRETGEGWSNRFPAVPWPAALEVPPPWEGGDGTAKIKSEKAKSKSETAKVGSEAVRR